MPFGLAASGLARNLGSMMHLSPLSQGWHQHFLQGLSQAVNPGDWLISYLCLPSTNRPVTVMLEWLAVDANGVASWGHRAFWGSDILSPALTDTANPLPSAFWAGPLPAAGQWTQLALPASYVGLEGQAVQGMAFAIYDGTAAWDLSGKFVPELPSQGLSQGSGASSTNGSSGLGGVAGSGAGVVNQDASCVEPPAGLVSWWRGEANANDAGSGFNNGVAYYVAYTTGVVNQAFSFDGYNANVWVADNPNLRLTNALTLEAWVKPTANAGQAILSKWDMYNGLGQMSYNFYLDSGGHLCLTLSPSGNYSGAIIVSSSSTLPLGAWTHVAGTFDGTNVTVYTNGVPQGSTNWASTIYPGTNALGIGGVVGGGSYGAAGGLFYGAIDEASVYSTCLAASNILAIYDAGSAGKCVPPTPSCVQPASGLVSWWRAEGTAADSEGLNNGTATSLTYDAYGEVNVAFAFNGSSANVWVPDNASLHFTNALTLEAWVKPTASAGQAILSKWDMYNGLGQMSYNFYLDSGNHVCLTLSDTGDYTHAIVVELERHRAFGQLDPRRRHVRRHKYDGLCQWEPAGVNQLALYNP